MMFDDRIRLADSLIKAVVAIGGLAAVIVGGIRYLDQRDSLIQQERLKISAQVRESRKTFIDAQFRLYSEAVSVAVRLARYPIQAADLPAFKKDHARFYQLYWGELAVVEDQNVERAMVIFREKLVSAQKNKRNELCMKSLSRASLYLARCVRKSLSRRWDCRDPACSDLDYLELDKKCTLVRAQEIRSMPCN